MLKWLARYILKDEIERQSEHIKSLQKRLIPHLPKIEANGEDQTDNIQFHLDVRASASLVQDHIK